MIMALYIFIQNDFLVLQTTHNNIWSAPIFKWMVSKYLIFSEYKDRYELLEAWHDLKVDVGISDITREHDIKLTG